MIKKHGRWIALLVAITFAWVMQLSTMPLAAGDKTEAVPASAEQAPGFFEQLGPDWNRRVKATTVLIIVGAVVALALLYFLIHGIDIDAAPRDGMSASAANRGRIVIR